jgi:tRNA A-37 threonylcarbamoyl transferase component Bud32
MRQAIAGDDDAFGTAVAGSAQAHEPTLDDIAATQPKTDGPATGAAPSPAHATGDRKTDPHEPTETADGHGATRDLPRGATVRYFGDYEIQKELGRGGMGVVYKARQISLNRPVALKLIKAGVLADDAELRRFQNEAEAVALLDHPGIVPVYEVGEHEGQRYFSMKLIEGGNLSEHLASFKDDPVAAVTLLTETAEAVQHAHLRGVLHRDLKPANILIDTEGHPHITDFGLAKRVEDDVDMTASGAILGTPAYMGPEQAAGRRGTITTATDVYGLGAIFYALLTGKAPFGGEGVIETLDAVRSRPPEPPTKRNAKVPRDLELICLKCLEKAPADRYPTAGALADDLRRWAAGETVSVRAAGAVERLAKWARRKPTIAAAYTLGLLTLLFGGLGGVAVLQWRAAARARDGEATARAIAEQALRGETTARATAERALRGEAIARVNAESAEEAEATARATAERARDGEATARAAAEQQREKFERFDYGRTMQVAYQEWRENNVPATVALLEDTRPDLRGWEWRYVHRLCHSDLLTLKGHTTSLTSASFSPDGSRIVTASLDKTAKLWDARNGTEIHTFKGHTDFVYSASFSPDGSRVVTASKDKTAKVWDAKTGADLRTLKAYDSTLEIETNFFIIWSASFSPDGSRVVTASNDGVAKVWETNTGREVLKLKGHTREVNSASFSPDGSRIVTASNDGWARAVFL